MQHRILTRHAYDGRSCLSACISRTTIRNRCISTSANFLVFTNWAAVAVPAVELIACFCSVIFLGVRQTSRYSVSATVNKLASNSDLASTTVLLPLPPVSPCCEPSYVMRRLKSMREIRDALLTLTTVVQHMPIFVRQYPSAFERIIANAANACCRVPSIQFSNWRTRTECVLSSRRRTSTQIFRTLPDGIGIA